MQRYTRMINTCSQSMLTETTKLSNRHCILLSLKIIKTLCSHKTYNLLQQSWCRINCAINNEKASKHLCLCQSLRIINLFSLTRWRTGVYSHANVFTYLVEVVYDIGSQWLIFRQATVARQWRYWPEQPHVATVHVNNPFTNLLHILQLHSESSCKLKRNMH